MRAKTPLELRLLQQDLWRVFPPTTNSYGRWEETGPKLSHEEVEAVLAAIPEYGLVCELTTVSFGFGRVGVNLYLDESYPGVGPDFLFCLSENHFDPADYPWVNEATQGSVHLEAWDLFKAAHGAQNIQRLKALGLQVLSYGALCY